jgi:hypothetical protein
MGKSVVEPESLLTRAARIFVSFFGNGLKMLAFSYSFSRFFVSPFSTGLELVSRLARIGSMRLTDWLDLEIRILHRVLKVAHYLRSYCSGPCYSAARQDKAPGEQLYEGCSRKKWAKKSVTFLDHTACPSNLDHGIPHYTRYYELLELHSPDPTVLLQGKDS